jgi:hypothetical protein
MTAIEVTTTGLRENKRGYNRSPVYIYQSHQPQDTFSSPEEKHRNKEKGF